MSRPEQDEDLDYHLVQIQEHVMAARAESGQVTPWDFDLPTSTEFREMREACGMSVEEMGEEMGYSSETIRQVERGQPPGREFIQEALRTLKMEWPR